MRVRAKLTLKNALAIECREKIGLSQIEVGKACEVPQASVSAIECLSFARVSDAQIRRLANFYLVKPEDLVPPDLRDKVLLSKAEMMRDIPTDRLIAWQSHAQAFLPDLDAPEQEARLKQVIAKELDTLTENYRKVVVLRHGLDGKGDRTLKEIGSEIGFSAERAKQIYDTALQKLRKPVHSKPMAAACSNQIIKDDAGIED